MWLEICVQNIHHSGIARFTQDVSCGLHLLILKLTRYVRPACESLVGLKKAPVMFEQPSCVKLKLLTFTIEAALTSRCHEAGPWLGKSGETLKFSLEMRENNFCDSYNFTF